MTKQKLAWVFTSYREGGGVEVIHLVLELVISHNKTLFDPRA